MDVIIHRDFAQGTDTWWEHKRGKPSASCFQRIITSRGKLSAGADRYIAELITDIVQQTPPYFSGRGSVVRRPYLNDAMENGQMLEAEARKALEMDSGKKIEQVGLCTSDDGRFCFSPDGLVIGENGGVEIKCPSGPVHAEYLMKGTLPRQYLQQVHGGLAISGYDYWLFYSYSPPLDQLLIRVEPTEFTEALKSALEQFWERYQAAKQKLLGAA